MPGAYWKVIIVEPVGQSRKVAAFIINQDANGTDDYAASLTTIKVIQDRNKLSLFPNLPANLYKTKDDTWVASWKNLN